MKIAARDARIAFIGLMSGYKFKGEFGMKLSAFKRVRYEGSTLRSRDEPYQCRPRDSLVKHALPKFEDGLFKVYVEKVFP
jgi:NADPH:quinone reductase-like Zn-dependent oxidoreductase